MIFTSEAPQFIYTHAGEAKIEMLADATLPRDQVLTGTFDGLLTGGLEMGWQARMTTVEMSPSPAAGQPCLQRIELQIWWTSGQQKRSFTLDSFRSHILMPEDL